MARLAYRRRALQCCWLVATTALASNAWALTLTQNLSWTIDRPGTSTVYRLTAYGDSLYGGYNGTLSRVAKRAAPLVDGEYLSELWNADIEVVRRTKAGALAADIFNNKIVAERSFMQASTTRVVTFEMCGNDGLRARSLFAAQTGACNYAPFTTAQNNCATYLQAAMQYINANAYPGTVRKLVTNLYYYPGYDADAVLAGCTDADSGQPPSRQDVFLPVLARMNWRTCSLAATYGFACVDSFAQYMGADYDSNGDGQVDAVALRYVQGESESAYVHRIAVTLRSTIRDPSAHLASPGTSYDYIQSDGMHPSYVGPTLFIGLIGGSGAGTGAADYAGGQIVDGRNPVWDRVGHERLGWALSTFNPPTP